MNKKMVIGALVFAVIMVTVVLLGVKFSVEIKQRSNILNEKLDKTEENKTNTLNIIPTTPETTTNTFKELDNDLSSLENNINKLDQINESQLIIPVQE